MFSKHQKSQTPRIGVMRSIWAMKLKCEKTHVADR